MATLLPWTLVFLWCTFVFAYPHIDTYTQNGAGGKEIVLTWNTTVTPYMQGWVSCIEEGVLESHPSLNDSMCLFETDTTLVVHIQPWRSQEGEWSLHVQSGIVHDGNLHNNTNQTVVITYNITDPPIALLSASHYAEICHSFAVDASASYGQQGEPILFSWQVDRPIGGSLAFENTSALLSSWFINEEGSYTFTVTVQSAWNESLQDIASVKVDIGGASYTPLCMIQGSPVVKVDPTHDMLWMAQGSKGCVDSNSQVEYSWTIIPAPSTPLLFAHGLGFQIPKNTMDPGQYSLRLECTSDGPVSNVSIQVEYVTYASETLGPSTGYLQVSPVENETLLYVMEAIGFASSQYPPRLTYEWTVDGNYLTLSSSPSAFLLTALPQGAHTVGCVVRDVYGQSATSSVDVVVPSYSATAEDWFALLQHCSWSESVSLCKQAQALATDEWICEVEDSATSRVLQYCAEYMVYGAVQSQDSKFGVSTIRSLVERPSFLRSRDLLTLSSALQEIVRPIRQQGATQEDIQQVLAVVSKLAQGGVCLSEWQRNVMQNALRTVVDAVSVGILTQEPCNSSTSQQYSENGVEIELAWSIQSVGAWAGLSVTDPCFALQIETYVSSASPYAHEDILSPVHVLKLREHATGNLLVPDGDPVSVLVSVNIGEEEVDGCASWSRNKGDWMYEDQCIMKGNEGGTLLCVCTGVPVWGVAGMRIREVAGLPWGSIIVVPAVLVVMGGLGICVHRLRLKRKRKMWRDDDSDE